MSIRLEQNFCKNSNAIRIEMKITFVRCLLGSMVSQWDILGKLLCLYINSKRLLTSAALLLSSSNLGAIPETAIVFSFFFKDIHISIIHLVI